MEGTVQRSGTEQGGSRPGRDTRDSGSQTDSRIQGRDHRFSNVNLFTLLSLWMELFPREPHGEEEEEEEEVVEEDQEEGRGMGLVVVRDNRVLGLHCSGRELHAGQAAIIQHGALLAECQLYFSRRPCATCLKMIINAGVRQISYWPGDPEVSVLRPAPSNHSDAPGRSPMGVSEEAALDAVATEKLKSNSGARVCVLLQPLPPGTAQFVHETSRECDFMEMAAEDESETDKEELFHREWARHLRDLSRRFLVATPQQHRNVLRHMCLENFCAEPYFSSLRNNMRELVEVLAAVAAGVPLRHHGFYREESSTAAPSLPPHQEGVSQEVAHHCIIQARLLSYRTDDPKVGVGAVIWARGLSAGCDGLGRHHLVGCGYNAYPAGSHYAEFPQMDDKQEDRRKRKYRYIVHAEQNAITFRSREIRGEEATMLFVTKYPCDECVTLIRGAGITHVYTNDQDRDKDKGDISYLRFSSLKGIRKFMWQRSSSLSSASSPHITNGYVGKHRRQKEQDKHSSKRLCGPGAHDSTSVS